MPILKQSPISQSKKRPRIGRDMISAPLGDFRHTMHVGRGGDVFGDTSFLSNHGGPKANGLPPATEALAPAQSPSRLSGSSGSPADLGGVPGILDLPPTSWEGELQQAESLFSFELDLGPSILDEVLGVMDKGGEQPQSEDRVQLPSHPSIPPYSLHPSICLLPCPFIHASPASATPPSLVCVLSFFSSFILPYPSLSFAPALFPFPSSSVSSFHSFFFLSLILTP
uniref:CDC42 effector protein 5 n=1 Tax=Gopherus evgoodei TaxID=1825980 RepID=A0A8C4Y5I3_9SAUR